MLTIHALDCAIDDTASVGGAADYVLNRSDGPTAFSRGAYYAGDEMTEADGPAVWHGAPAALGQLGVEAGTAVERAHLVAALQGRHAVTRDQIRRPGNRLVESDDGVEVQRIVKSVDLTFSVPKSLSVAWSQAGPEERGRIEADVIDAARRTIDFMATQKGCVHRRDADGERYREPAAGVVAALSLHVTARQAAGDQAPAPQLHVHGVVVGLLRRDGLLVTPDPWAWYRDNAAREGGALGRSLLAERLASRGYAIESETGKKSRYFELAGVPAALRTALSGRSREVATRVAALELAQGRRITGGALAVVAKDTRAPKTEIDHGHVTSWWDAVAGEHGFRHAQAEALRDSARQAPADDRAVAEALLRRLAAEGPTVTTVEARSIALEVSAGRTAPRRAIEILGELQQRGWIIALANDRVTTKPIRDLETTVLRFARRAAGAGAALPDETIRAGIARAESSLGQSLDAEQADAVHTICSGPLWTNLIGRAGVGKGPTLEAVAHAHRAAGWQVLACAVDGTTAQRLAHQVCDSGYTIDGLVTRIAHERIVCTSETLVIVDEASKVDTARWANLVRCLDDRGTRVLAVGDEGQLQAIELPGLFSELIQRTPTVSLSTVRRHRDPSDPAREHPWLPRYQAALHDGRGHDAIALLQEHDSLKLHDTRAEAMVALVEEWSGWRHEYPVDRSMLLVHGTNGDVDTVNQLAQADRLAAGDLGPRSIQAPDREYHLHEGDEVVLRGAPLRLRNGARIENGTSMRIVDIDEARRRLTVEMRRPDGPSLENVELLAFDTPPGASRAPALRLAYAMHPNPAQGATVDRTATLGHPIADRNATYVADTRARYGHTVHLAREDLGTDGTDADRLERYATAISESRTRSAGIAHSRDPSRRLDSYRDISR